jgi:hypothetical protein
MERNIYLLYKKLDELPLIPFLYTFETETDIEPLVRWMLQSEIQLQRHLDSTGSVYLDMSRFKPDIRDKALTILLQLGHEGTGEMHLHLRLHVNDRPSLANLLPQTIHHLKISVNESTDPTVLAAIIRSLPEISALDIFAYSKGSRQFRCHGSCFITPLTFPNVLVDERATSEAGRIIEPSEHRVSVIANGACSWEIWPYGRDPYRWDGLKEAELAGCNSLYRSLTNEIVGLLSLNPKLHAINARFKGFEHLK